VEDGATVLPLERGVLMIIIRIEGPSTVRPTRSRAERQFDNLPVFKIKALASYFQAN
jgi:hypothetical protein